jgi:hypothetical protein
MSAPDRTVDEQRAMLQDAIAAVRRVTARSPFHGGRQDEVRAALRNQEVQALTLIALEMGQLINDKERTSCC